jgi:hypothetical protein
VIQKYKYQGHSGISNALGDGRVAFATNTLREATFFHGQLGKPILFREGLAGLYEVVVSDFKYRPRDRVAFKAWLEEQDKKFLANLGMKSEAARKKSDQLNARLGELDALRDQRLAPFYRARQKYFEYVYEHEYETSYLFDPVITVHPDELSFEAFSRDESSYARLAARYDLFDKVDSFECGTTNIDFSVRLHDELDRMRTYRKTRFDVSPGGFQVATEGGSAHHEKKIDLPESWVKGFLQVHSTMAMGLHHFKMAPIDLYNVTRFLQRKKARQSPRALRYELEPGKPTRVVFEPWEHAITLSGVSKFEGPKAVSVRTWGRDRLRTLARLLHVTRGVDVYLAGFGLPSIYVLDLGPLLFTLGLSGWTDNDWTGRGTQFDLLTRQLTVSAPELMAVFEALRKVKRAPDDELQKLTGLGLEKVRSATSYLCQTGRAMFDLAGGVYRHRELFLEPFTVKEAQETVSKMPSSGNPREVIAQQIFDAGNVRIIMQRPVKTGFKLSGSAKGPDSRRVRPLLSVDKAGKIIEGTCSCEFFRQHKLTKGPCEHLLALRLAHMDRLSKQH